MKTAARWAVLVIVYVVSQALAGILMPLVLSTPSATSHATPPPWQLLLYLVVTLPMLAYLIHRPHIRGPAQLGLVALFVWGIQTFMTQIETAYFWSAFPTVSRIQMLYLFLRNLVTLTVFLPAALWLTGRMRSRMNAPSVAEFRDSLALDVSFAWKLPALGIAYVVLYFIFGYYVAWQFDAVRMFYSGSSLLESFGAQLRTTIIERPGIIGFQFLRGLLWVAFTWPMLAFLGRSRFERVVAGAALLGFLPTTQLIFNNPLMPPEVRLGHFIEVSASMVIFGALLATVMSLRTQARVTENASVGFSP